MSQSLARLQRQTGYRHSQHRNISSVEKSAVGMKVVHTTTDNKSQAQFYCTVCDPTEVHTFLCNEYEKVGT